MLFFRMSAAYANSDSKVRFHAYRFVLPAFLFRSRFRLTISVKPVGPLL
jgi:hypothetical protein